VFFVRGRHFLERGKVGRISTGSRSLKIYLPGDGAHCDAWAWTFLTACLATFVSYDEARAVVNRVRYGEVGS
jgi:hypothetical protein